jgi:hypothetical protein
MKPDRFGKPVRFFVSTRHYKFDSVPVQESGNFHTIEKPGQPAPF